MKSSFQRAVFGPNYHWWALGVISLAVLASTIDSGLVSISLPVIMTYFQADLSFAGWVILINSLVTACLFIPLGRLADLIGDKKIMTSGFILYSVGSAIAGLSQNPAQLIVFRILQAIGNALMVSNSFALLTTLFPAEERGKAMGLTGGLMTAVGFTIGPFLGGLLIHSFGWRSVFFVPASVGVAGFLAAQFLLREQKMQMQRGKIKEPFDFVGMGIFILGLTSLFVGLTTGQNGEWDSTLVIGELVLAVLSLYLFLWWESHTKYPMLDLKLFRIRTFSSGNGARLAIFTAQTMHNLAMPFFLQLGLGFSPLAAGAIMSPLAITIAIVAPISGWISDKSGGKFISLLGLAVSSAGFFMLSGLTTGASHREVLTGIALIGTGVGLFQPHNNTAVMNSVPTERLGVASAFLSLIRSLGYSFGIAIATTIIISSLIALTGQGSLQGLREANQSGQNPALLSAFLLGYKYTYITGGAICIAGIVASVFTGTRNGRTPSD